MIYFTRPDWGAVHGRGAINPGPKPWVVVHHFASPDIPCGATIAEEAKAIRGVEAHHAGKGWAGIGYNFVITQSGHIYEGRGWGRIGSHAKGRNSTSVGVCFAIDGDAHDLTPAAIKAFRDLVDAGVGTGEIAPDHKIVGHRDVWATACPGDRIYAQLPELWP